MNWRVTPDDDTAFHLGLDLDISDQLTTNNLDDSRAGAAVLAWLESIRHDGNPVGDNPASLPDVSSREYRVAQNATETVHFTIGSLVSNSFSGTNFLSRFEFDCNVVNTGDDLNTIDLNDTVEEATVAVPVADNLEIPTLGSDDAPIRLKEILLPGGRKMFYRGDHFIYSGIDEDGHHYDIPQTASYGRTIPYDDLPTSGGTKRIPNEGHVDTVHFGPEAAADGEVLIGSPEETVLQANVHRILSFHNLDNEYNLNLLDRESNTWFVVYPRNTSRSSSPATTRAAVKSSSAPRSLASRSSPAPASPGNSTRWTSGTSAPMTTTPFNS